MIACTSKNKPEKAELAHNQITLIFKSPPAKWKVYREAGGYTPAHCEINFIDDNFIPIQFFPDSEHEFDTLIIKTKRKVVEFIHSHKGIDELSYIFHNGDTVLFTYKDKTPIASVLNRRTKTHDVDFDLLKKETFYPEDYSSYAKYISRVVYISYATKRTDLIKLAGTGGIITGISCRRHCYCLVPEKRNKIIWHTSMNGARAGRTIC